MAFPNAVINGTPVNFTFQSVAGITIAGINGVLLQNASYKTPTKRVLVMDGNGNRTTSAHTDPIKTATLKWKVSGTGLANAITNTMLQANGNFVQITACDSMPELVATFEVIGGEVTGSNEDVKEISLEIEYAPNIQSLAPA